MSSWIRQIKEGESMTRICAVANNSTLVVSADSLFTNTLNSQITEDNLKLCYKDDMIIGILGTSELLTGQGVFSLHQFIQDDMNKCNNIDREPIQYIYHIQAKVKDICARFMFQKPCLIIHFWKNDNRFYAYYYQIYAKFYQFGQGNIVCQSDIGQIQHENKDLFCINQTLIECGDGLHYNPTISKGHYLSPFDLSISHVHQAIMDSSIPTVGGSIYTIRLENHNFTTYINGKKRKW